MQQGWGTVEIQLEELLALTNNITPPADACNTWRALYRGLLEFRDDLMQHIHLENNVLFVNALTPGTDRLPLATHPRQPIGCRGFCLPGTFIDQLCQ